MYDGYALFNVCNETIQGAVPVGGSFNWGLLIYMLMLSEPIARKAVEHIGTHYGIKMAGNGLLSDLKASVERSGVDYVVFHSTATKPTQVSSVNDWIIKNSGGMMIGFGTIHPDFEDPEGEIDRLIRAGLKGIKLHPDFQGFDADSPRMDRIYRCIGSRVPVLMHAGDEKLDHASPERIANVIERFPELRLIAAHQGHQKWKEAGEFLIGKNLWLDIKRRRIHGTSASGGHHP